MRRALLVAALLCACREKAAPPPPTESPQGAAAPERVREQEPNDFQRAQQIPARAVVTGSLQAPKDDDWYRVGVPGGKTLALRVELEPNDRAVDATPLQPGKPVQGTYLSAEDEDWYRLEVSPSATEVLRIEVTAVAGVRPDLEVRALSDASLLATFHGADALLVRD